MSRKQVDYVFRQLRYSSVDPNVSTAANSEWIRANYLSQGYEVLSSSVVRVDNNDVFVGIAFVKYEDVPVLEKASAKSG
jgi:hypothetical protein